MKFHTKSVLALLSNAALSNAQSAMKLASTSLAMKESFSNVNNAIDNFITGVDPQPVCTDPIDNRKFFNVDRNIHC